MSKEIDDVIDNEINFMDDSVNFIDDGVDDEMCHLLEAVNVDDVDKTLQTCKKLDIDIEALELIDATAIENRLEIFFGKAIKLHSKLSTSSHQKPS